MIGVEVHFAGLWLTAPLAALAVGFGSAEAIVLNRRLRTRPHGRELRWACSALMALAMLATLIPVGLAYAWIVSGSVPLVLICLARLRSEWGDRSREFFA